MPLVRDCRRKCSVDMYFWRGTQVVTYLYYVIHNSGLLDQEVCRCIGEAASHEFLKKVVGDSDIVQKEQYT